MKKFIAALSVVLTLPGGLPAQSAYPEPNLREPVGDWLIECYGDESRNGNCQLYHRVLMNNATQIALVMTVAYTPDGGGPFLQMALPLGIDINSGAQLSFGADFDQSIPFTRCTDQGCIVEGQITARLLQSMRDTGSGTIGIITANGPLNIPVSMAGFGVGIDRIKPLPAAEPEVAPVEQLELPVDDEEPDTQLAPVTSGN